MSMKAPNIIPTADEFRTILRRRGLKATRQRLLVHEAMMELEHASAEMVKSKLEEKGHKVTSSSVYNILSQLADSRVYSRRPSMGSKMYFDVASIKHAHLYDRENDIFLNVDVPGISEWAATQIKRRRFRGFSVEDIEIEIIVHPTKKANKK